MMQGLFRRRTGWAACFVILGVFNLAGGAGGAGAESTAVRLTLDREFDGTAAPFLASWQKRYYRDEHLNVAIAPGSGSLESIERVASGKFQVGVADINLLIRYLDQNPGSRVKAIMMLQDIPAFAVIGRRSLGVETGKDLEGKVLGVTPPDPAFAHWSLFASVNGIEADRVRIDSRGYASREAGLEQGRIDAIIGSSHSSPHLLKSMGLDNNDIVVIPMAEHGLEIYGDAIIVNPDFAKQNPAAVRGFVRATLRGLFDVIADPISHVDIVLEHNDKARRAAEADRIERFVNDNVVTDWVKTHGLGGVDMGRLTRSVRQLRTTYGLTSGLTARRVFSWNFLPPKKDRMLP